MQDTTVYQRKGRKKWYLAYWCPVRMKRVWEVTPWSVDQPSGYKNALRLAAEKSRDAINMRDVAKRELFEAWVVKFLKDVYRSADQSRTLQRYLGAWDWIRVFIAENKIFHPRTVTYNHVLKFVEWRSNQRRHCKKLITRNTALLDVRVWSLIMREAMRREFADKNPCERLGLRRDPSKEKPAFTNEHLQIVLGHLAVKEGKLPVTERWMTNSFLIALYCACRLRATAIPMADVNLAANEVTIRDKGRNGVRKVRTIRIHPAVRPLFDELHAAGATETCTLPRMASKIWHSFFKIEHPELKAFTFHCTRVTTITRFAQAGVPEPQARAYVGHGRGKVHEIYQRLRAEDLTQCQKALDFGAPASSPPPPPNLRLLSDDAPEKGQNRCA